MWSEKENQKLIKYLKEKVTKLNKDCSVEVLRP